MVRLAHFSDIHVTTSPLTEGAIGLLGKPGAGALNYYLGGRRHHFRGVEDRIRSLLEDVDAQNVDHALCTGDITAMSYDLEFARCADLFGGRLEQPERYTVIPGNHDRYTELAVSERRFERYFGPVADQGAGYPFQKKLAEGVYAVLLDVSRPTGALDSSGYCGPEQLARTRSLLEAPELEGAFRILALHYGLLRRSGLPDRPTHGLRDWTGIAALVEHGPGVDMILHGHMHRAYRVDLHGVPVFCAGSATDLHRSCGYNVYDIDPVSKQLSVERRTWDRERGQYGPAESSS